MGYGAYANNAFRYYNRDIAEGITATGQLAIRYIEREINLFLNDTLKTNLKDFVTGIDTDSLIFTTLIKTDKGNLTIGNLYDEYAGEIIRESKDNFTVKPNKPLKVLAYKDGKVVYRPVNYIKKHKVKKKMYSLKVNGNEVIVTQDHSLIVERDGKVIPVKPCEVLPSDTFISIKE